MEKVVKRQLKQVVASWETDPPGDRFQHPSSQDSGTWGDLGIKRGTG